MGEGEGWGRHCQRRILREARASSLADCCRYQTRYSATCYFVTTELGFKVCKITTEKQSKQITKPSTQECILSVVSSWWMTLLAACPCLGACSRQDVYAHLGREIAALSVEVLQIGAAVPR